MSMTLKNLLKLNKKLFIKRARFNFGGSDIATQCPCPILCAAFLPEAERLGCTRDNIKSSDKKPTENYLLIVVGFLGYNNSWVDTNPPVANEIDSAVDGRGVNLLFRIREIVGCDKLCFRANSEGFILFFFK